MEFQNLKSTDQRSNKVKIIVSRTSGDLQVMEGEETESLLRTLASNKIHMNASCGGRGSCGKCKIKLLQGTLEVTPPDRSIFTNAQIQEGYRLACKAYPHEDIHIMLIEKEEDEFEVLSFHGGETIEDKAKNLTTKKITETLPFDFKRFDYGIGVDLGTTTLALTLVNLSNGEGIDTYTTVNHQRSFGADVITRIQLSSQGKQKELQECIRQDLLLGIRTLLEKRGIPSSNLKKITIAGNTTMGHLLLGYSCHTLGTYPFAPVDIQERKFTFSKVFGCSDYQADVVLLPGISTFVGGDIIAGLLVCNFDQEDAINIFIDLGTNGEMAIGNKNKLFVTSTAAGPAFEGGNLSCGVGSISGAISGVEIEDGKIQVQTIGGEKPIGICGTGVLELTSELLKEKIMDDTGLLSPEYFDDGYEVASNHQVKVVYTQRDIREFQMAKAAIRAGIEILVKEYGVGYDAIHKLYIAGGFGYKINRKKAFHIGLLPRELEGKIETIGNSSLEGAIKYLLEKDSSYRAKEIVEVAKEIHLSNDADFNDWYISYMGFEEEGLSI